MFERNAHFVFTEQKINGRHLCMMQKCDGEMLIKCGLKTVGDQMEFSHHLESLVEGTNTKLKAKERK